VLAFIQGVSPPCWVSGVSFTVDKGRPPHPLGGRSLPTSIDSHLHVRRTGTGLAEKTPPFLVLCMVTFSMHGTNDIGMDLLIAARHMGANSRTWSADLEPILGQDARSGPSLFPGLPEDRFRRSLAGIVARAMAVWMGCLLGFVLL
jgi:hypothetical protein